MNPSILKNTTLCQGANCKSAEYDLLSLLETIEGDLAPVSCLTCSAPICPRKSQCRTLPMWSELNSLIKGYLSNKSLADLIGKDLGNDYVI